MIRSGPAALLFALLLAFLLALDCATASGASLVPPAARRGAEQTLLTYPEWFLVHSPAEYATFIATEPSHRFPFVGHVGQLWQGYAAVTREQWRERAPPNLGYHVMIGVIATSTTVEYLLRSAYENTIGRIGWALGSGRLTDEDRFAARVAQRYVDFIREEPWYLFDFEGAVVGLWRDVPVFGDGFVRKWERRYALTTEYVVKALYARLIEKATRATYEPALFVTEVVADRLPDAMPPQVRVLRVMPDGRAVLALPRYAAFLPAATELARHGARLVDIAGNDTYILVTAWSRDAARWPTGSKVLFEQPILTRPGTRRIAALIPVDALSAWLVDAPQQHLAVEHIYDY